MINKNELQFEWKLLEILGEENSIHYELFCFGGLTRYSILYKAGATSALVIIKRIDPSDSHQELTEKGLMSYAMPVHQENAFEKAKRYSEQMFIDELQNFQTLNYASRQLNPATTN